MFISKILFLLSFPNNPVDVEADYKAKWFKVDYLQPFSWQNRIVKYCLRTTKNPVGNCQSRKSIGGRLMLEEVEEKTSLGCPAGETGPGGGWAGSERTRETETTSS